MSQDPDENADHPRRTKTKRVMVSTEENSLSELLGAALPKGVLAGLPGLRGISSPDVPAFAAKPAVEAFSYGTATPAMGELAEAALAYTHDEPHAATTQAPATLELVADNGPADEKSTDTLAQEQLEAARAAAVMEIEEMIEQARLNGDDEGKMRLEAILNSVKGAKTISAITAAQSLTGQASGGKVETPEQKRERLWNEIEALNKKTLEGIDALKDNGLMDKKEADQWKDELTEIMEMPNGEEKAKRLADFNKRYGNRLQEILDSLSLDDPRRKLVEGEIAREKEKNQKIEEISAEKEQDKLRTLVVATGDDTRKSMNLDVISVAPEAKNDTAHSVTISVAQDVSAADSGLLPTPEVTRVAAATQSAEFSL